jgi:hypothetical protein
VLAVKYLLTKCEFPEIKWDYVWINSHFVYSRNEADRLGGLWKGGTAFPIHVLKDVCSIAAKRNRERILADHLPDYRVVSAQSAHQMLKGWIEEKGDDATLESLFQAAYEAGLFDALEQEINRRIEQQSPVDGK